MMLLPHWALSGSHSLCFPTCLFKIVLVASILLQVTVIWFSLALFGLLPSIPYSWFSAGMPRPPHFYTHDSKDAYKTFSEFIFCLLPLKRVSHWPYLEPQWPNLGFHLSSISKPLMNFSGAQIPGEWHSHFVKEAHRPQTAILKASESYRWQHISSPA